MVVQPTLTDSKLLELDASGLPLVVVTPLVREHLAGCTSGHKSLAAAASRADRPQTTLAWGRRYLPKYFTKPASLMHEWLAAQLDACRAARGSKVNLVGPRGSAKSTIATLCYVLRMAVEEYEPYIWIVSDTAQQAKLHLENVKLQLTNNEALAEDYPHAVGSGPRCAAPTSSCPTAS